MASVATARSKRPRGAPPPPPPLPTLGASVVTGRLCENASLDFMTRTVNQLDGYLAERVMHWTISDQDQTTWIDRVHRDPTGFTVFSPVDVPPTHQRRPVTRLAADGVTKQTIEMTAPPPPVQWRPLADFDQLQSVIRVVRRERVLDYVVTPYTLALYGVDHARPVVELCHDPHGPPLQEQLGRALCGALAIADAVAGGASAAEKLPADLAVIYFPISCSERQVRQKIDDARHEAVVVVRGRLGRDAAERRFAADPPET